MARAGAGDGESSAVRKASRGIKASDDADPWPLCARASGVTAVTVTRPCCACPGQRIASRRQDPGNHARWPRWRSRSGAPSPSGGSGPSIPPSNAPRPSPCAELWPGGPGAAPGIHYLRPRFWPRIVAKIGLYFGPKSRTQIVERPYSLFEPP